MANPHNPDQKPVKDEHCDDGEQPQPNEPAPPPSGRSCEELEAGPKPPCLDDPATCEPRCQCPTQPPATGTCLDDLIADQAKVVNEAKRADDFKKELEELLKKANAARQGYTREKYEDFKKRWERQDGEIVCLIEHVICKVRCWECLIECEICPLLYRIRWIEEKLDGDGTLISAVHSLRDLRYWHERNRDEKARRFNRIKDVLNAWSDPARSIDAALIANDKLIKGVGNLERAESVLQIFFKLVPLHLAIAPRDAQTNIDAKYVELCGDCDTGEADDCCGPDVGVLSARQRMNEPQAYIIYPDRYFEILCCLAKERYLPAKDQLAKAEAELLAVEAQIVSLTADLERRKKSIVDDFKARIPVPFECQGYPDRPDGRGHDGKDTPPSEITVR